MCLVWAFGCPIFNYSVQLVLQWEIKLVSDHILVEPTRNLNGGLGEITAAAGWGREDEMLSCWGRGLIMASKVAWEGDPGRSVVDPQREMLWCPHIWQPRSSSKPIEPPGWICWIPAHGELDTLNYQENEWAGKPENPLLSPLLPPACKTALTGLVWGSQAGEPSRKETRQMTWGRSLMAVLSEARRESRVEWWNGD